MSETPRAANRLIREKSPYLLQHAHNPVDWYPWGEEAFARARREDKPIFLSIGYSTCHWCHVMERESFENEAIAELLNRSFVAIKVDREERPDVDHIYMTAVQALTGAGGWPLSAWLTPERQPFYAGTYFPPDSRWGRPGFRQLLEHLHRAWSEDRTKVLDSAARITDALGRFAGAHRISEIGEFGELDLDAALRTALARFTAAHDPVHGGFGSAPKFPRPTTLSFLLRAARRYEDAGASRMAVATLRAMWAGGIHDHLGGGYHRYSVDAYWRVPHFEKMLYDQAQLVWAFLEAYQTTAEPDLAAGAHEILDYVRRDLTHAEGGFCSAEDADSAADPAHPNDKEEGAFYLWERSEIEALLEPDEAEVICERYGVSAMGNTLSDPQGELGTRNVLYAAASPEQVAARLDLGLETVLALLRSGREKLLRERARRPRPQLDDKVITSWNGLMISAFARAYAILRREEDLESARRAARFVLEHCRDPQTGRLYRRYREGEAAHPAQLADYACLVLGLLDLYEASLELPWLEHAESLAEVSIERFRDPAGGGFFDTAGDDPSLLVRSKEGDDGAEPAGGAVAAMVLLRLAHMLERPAWRELAEGELEAVAALLAQAPDAAPYRLCAADLALAPPAQIVLWGAPGAAELRALTDAVHRPFCPGKVLLYLDAASRAWLGERAPFLGSLEPTVAPAGAFLCRAFACDLPTSDPEALERALDSGR